MALGLGVVRVDADRAVDVGEAPGDRAHPVELAQAGADGDHGADAGGAGAGDHVVERLAVLQVIQVTVGIDENLNASFGPKIAPRFIPDGGRAGKS